MFKDDRNELINIIELERKWVKKLDKVDTESYKFRYTINIVNAYRKLIDTLMEYERQGYE